MSRTGQRLIVALKEAVAIARHELKAPRVTVLFHVQDAVPNAIRSQMNKKEAKVADSWREYYHSLSTSNPIVKITLTTNGIGTGITLECMGEKHDITDYESW